MVARRSPATTTPSAQRTAIIVVPSTGCKDASGATVGAAGKSPRSLSKSRKSQLSISSYCPVRWR